MVGDFEKRRREESGKGRGRGGKKKKAHLSPRFNPLIALSSSVVRSKSTG